MGDRSPELVQPFLAKERLTYCGALLRATRENASLTLEALEAKSGVSRSAIGHMECGHGYLTLPNMAAVCVALNISMDAFFPVETSSDEAQLALEVRRRPGMARAFLELLKLTPPRRTRTLAPTHSSLSSHAAPPL
jgi:transcriptional regulator with XRE-family HTH domain